MDLEYPPGSSGFLVDSKEVDEGEMTGKQGVDSDLRKEDQSWASKVKDKKKLKKYEVEISIKDGKHKVEIPDEVITDSNPIWDDFVVGKFLDLAPHIAKVNMVVNKVWKYGDLSTKVDVYDVNPTTMRFKVSNPKARGKILKRGMWNIAGVPMIVTKWSPQTEEEKQEEKAIPMWVHLTNVPLHIY